MIALLSILKKQLFLVSLAQHYVSLFFKKSKANYFHPYVQKDFSFCSKI
jgi:hypothetical protein